MKKVSQKKINIFKKQNDNQIEIFLKLIYNIYIIILNNKILGLLITLQIEITLQTKKRLTKQYGFYSLFWWIIKYNIYNNLKTVNILKLIMLYKTQTI